jgi:hypothetical protein
VDKLGTDSDLSVHLYQRLRKLAAHYMRTERAGHTLSPTALVHEAFIRLAAPRRSEGMERTQFIALAACQMRRVLVDNARKKMRLKPVVAEPGLALRSRCRVNIRLYP